MCKRIFYSLLASSILLLLAACDPNTETRYVETDSSSSTVSPKLLETLQEPAEHVLHYQQKVLAKENGTLYVTDDSSGFELKETENKTVAQSAKFTDIAKDYPGFTLSGSVQKGKSVYLYYTRKTVTYIFCADGVPYTTVAGTYGLTCNAPAAIKQKDGKFVLSWKSKSDPSVILKDTFGTTDDSFIPNETKAIVGTKIRPDAEGDYVFADGSAATYAEVLAVKTAGTAAGASEEASALWNKYKSNIFAFIVFSEYNIYTGKMTGSTMIGVGLRAKDVGSGSGKWRESDSEVAYNSAIFHGRHTLQILQSLYPAETSKENFSKNFTAMHLAAEYGNKFAEKYKDDSYVSPLADDLKEGWYLPETMELEYAIEDSYPRYQQPLTDAVSLAGASIGSEFWSAHATRSSVLFTTSINAEYVGKAGRGQIYVSNEHDILPYRIFK